MYEINFINECLYGNAEIDEIDDYIDYWHTHDIDMTLREFLGMTKMEYEEWLKNDDSIIRDILRCRTDHIPFENYKTMSSSEKIAARSYSVEEIEKLKNGNNNE